MLPLLPRALETTKLTVARETPADVAGWRIRVHLTVDAQRTSLDDGVFALRHADAGQVCVRSRRRSGKGESVSGAARLKMVSAAGKTRRPRLKVVCLPTLAEKPSDGQTDGQMGAQLRAWAPAADREGTQATRGEPSQRAV